MKLSHLFLACTFFMFLSCESDLALGNLETGEASTEGSYANMLVVDNFMYVINNQRLKTFSLEDSSNPELLSDYQVGFEIESLLHYKGNLFIGSALAMYIYEIDEKGIPNRTSVTEYQLFGDDFCATDPIAANDNNAFASLATSALGNCARVDVNEIQVFDIQDLSNPQVIASASMDSPRGIALDGNYLFVTEAELGLKVLDVSNPSNPVQMYHFDGFKAFDVIANDGLLVVVGPDKIYEYDYSNIENMTYLSELDF